ncbi:MAG TPA: MarR family transcriptional regulator [Dermatophilaceae bacterium]|nr:MarR family transcriptional regulator [Dermatophilaceae bacterium]
MSDDARPARWLDEQEQRHWRAYLRGSRLLEAALDRDLQEHGLQLSEYEIISMLSEATDRHLRMSEIAELVVQSRSRLTHTAARLEKRGWVLRQPCSQDRRGVELVLTPAGQAAIRAMAPLHVESVRAYLVDHLTPEQFADLGEAMAAVRDGITGPPRDEPA